MHRTLLTVALFVAVALAGCSDDGTPAAAPGGEDAMAGDGPAPLEAPAWNVGDYWTYETSFGSTWDLVVTENGTSDYTVDTNDANLAFFHDQNEVSYLGAIRKSDLAGSQGSDRVVYYAFPLQDGKTWSTPWDGETMQVTATRTGDASFTFAATADGTLVYTYAYDAADRSLSEFRGYDANGTETFAMDLVDRGNGYTGDLVRVDADVVVEESAGGPVTSTDLITVPSIEVGDLYLNFQVTCPAVEATAGAAFAFAIGPAENLLEPTSMNDDGYNFAEPCPTQGGFAGVIGQEPNTGNWGYTVQAPGPGTSYSFQLWARHHEIVTL